MWVPPQRCRDDGNSSLFQLVLKIESNGTVFSGNTEKWAMMKMLIENYYSIRSCFDKKWRQLINDCNMLPPPSHISSTHLSNWSGKNVSKMRYQAIKKSFPRPALHSHWHSIPSSHVPQQEARWALRSSKDVLICMGKAPRTCLEEINPTRAAKVIPCKTFEIFLSSMSTLEAWGGWKTISRSSIRTISVAWWSPWSWWSSTRCCRFCRMAANKVDLGKVARILRCCLSSFATFTWGKWQKGHPSANSQLPFTKVMQGRWHSSGCPQLPRFGTSEVLIGDVALAAFSWSVGFGSEGKASARKPSERSFWTLTSNWDICHIIAWLSAALSVWWLKGGQLEDRLSSWNSSSTSMNVERYSKLIRRLLWEVHFKRWFALRSAKVANVSCHIVSCQTASNLKRNSKLIIISSAKAGQCFHLSVSNCQTQWTRSRKLWS